MPQPGSSGNQSFLPYPAASGNNFPPYPTNSFGGFPSYPGASSSTSQSGGYPPYMPQNPMHGGYNNFYGGVNIHAYVLEIRKNISN